MDENHLQKWANSCGFQPPFLPYNSPWVGTGQPPFDRHKRCVSPLVYNLYNLCLTTNRSPGFVSEVGTSPKFMELVVMFPFLKLPEGTPDRHRQKNAVTSSPRKTYSLKLIEEKLLTKCWFVWCPTMWIYLRLIYPLVNIQKTMERSTIFNGKTH